MAAFFVIIKLLTLQIGLCKKRINYILLLSLDFYWLSFSCWQLVLLQYPKSSAHSQLGIKRSKKEG